MRMCSLLDSTSLQLVKLHTLDGTAPLVRTQNFSPRCSKLVAWMHSSLVATAHALEL